MRGRGTKQRGVFTFEVVTDLDARTVSYTLSFGDRTGRPARKMLPGLRLLREFRHPNRLRIAPPFGSETWAPNRYLRTPAPNRRRA